MSSLTTLGLTRTQGATIEGNEQCLFEGRTWSRCPTAELRKIRGNEIAMIFQDPLSSLHPFYKVGAQLIEAVQTHRKVSKARRRARAVELLERWSDPRLRSGASTSSRTSSPAACASAR